MVVIWGHPLSSQLPSIRSVVSKTPAAIHMGTTMVRSTYLIPTPHFTKPIHQLMDVYAAVRMCRIIEKIAVVPDNLSLILRTLNVVL